MPRDDSAQDDGYLLANRQTEAGARFTALGELFDPSTFRPLDGVGLDTAWRCWEVGAGGRSVPDRMAERVGPGGLVVATDIDTSWLEHPEPPDQLRVLRHDVGTDPAPAADLDLAHARLVLTHVPRRDDALRTMVAALRPGGWIVVEEADPGLQPLLCPDEYGPEQELANRLRRGFRTLMAGRSADLAYGRTLPRRLRDHGLTEVGADAYFPITGPACTVLEIATVEQIRDRLVGEGVATADEVDKHLDNLAAGRVPDLATSPMITSWGRKLCWAPDGYAAAQRHADPVRPPTVLIKPSPPPESVGGQSYGTRVPKSRGRRRKPDKRARPPVARWDQPVPTTPGGRGRYATGRIRSRADRITGLVLNPDVPPDLMVELLPTVWWLENAVGYSTNRCAAACAVLHHAYATMGISAHPVAVELVTEDRRTGERTLYGRPDPHWDDTTFLGHCVLSLPGSGRFIDPTVEQYPEVRSYDLGPICGRTVATHGTARDRAAYRDGGLQPGAHVGVERGDLLLLYTAADAQYRDIVMNGPFVRDQHAELERAGRVIAAQALLMLAWPDVIDRAQQTPHPRVRALVSLLAGAEIVESGDDEDVQLRLAGETAVRGFEEILNSLPR